MVNHNNRASATTTIDSDDHYPHLSRHPTCNTLRKQRYQQQIHRTNMESVPSMIQYHNPIYPNNNMTSSVVQQHDTIATIQHHDKQYYVSCYVAGGLSSSIRWILSPLELIKTRLQTTSSLIVPSSSTTPIQHPFINSSQYCYSTRNFCTLPLPSSSSTTTTVLPRGPTKLPSLLSTMTSSPTMMGTLKQIYTTEGIVGLFRGVTPTAVAYWLQTSTKYSLYEYMKDQMIYRHCSTNNTNISSIDGWSRGIIYITAAATAEAIADILMCPFEMIKVKMQTASTIPMNQQPLSYQNMLYYPSKSLSSHKKGFPTQFIPALYEMIGNHQKYNFPFGSLAPVWGRQIPGTIINFVTFENAVSMIYRSMGEYDKSQYTSTQQLGVTVMAGYIAGICCAIVSHPADSIISLKSLPEYRHQSILQIIRHVGWYQLTTKGLTPRIVLTGQIIAFQWLLYDSIKSLFGYGTSGG